MTTDTVRDTRQSIELDIDGMTCASCAARIEKKLGKVEGVDASVNYATDKALVLAPTGLTAADLIKVVEEAGYGAHLPEPDSTPPDRAGAYRRRLIVAAVFAVPVILLAMVPSLQFPFWQWVSLVLTLPVVTWAAWPFHKSAWVNARHAATTMDTLISMGTSAATLWSLYALVFTSAGHPAYRHDFGFTLDRHHAGTATYFEAAVGIITFLLLGRWIEARSRRDAGAALRALLTMGAKEASIVRDGVETRLPIDQLVVGDHFVVRPGEKVATDGEVVEGNSAVDASLITGESVPVEVGPGSLVVGATINTSGRLLVRASAVGSDTQLSHIARLVEQAQTGKAAVQRLADRISGIFVPIVIGLALVTLIGWLVAGAEVGFAFTAAVAVLIIACPCALGLATPTALLAGTGRGSELGIVIRGPEVLEQARSIDTVVLDKTGTLTEGQMSVASHPAAGTTESQLTLVAAALENHSEHPIARAVVAAAGTRGLPEVSNFSNHPGRGVVATIDGVVHLVGNQRLLEDNGLALGAEVEDAAQAASGRGETLVFVATEHEVLGVIGVADTIKATSAEGIRQLKALGLTPVMVTGDHEAAARVVADSLGIDEVRASVLPANKVDIVREFQAQGRRVAMVGDGVNDAAALTQADLGMAMGSGTDAAIAASDITLMRPDMVLAADAVRLSRATLRTIKINLFWAFFYNVVALPVAALGFLNPMIASAAMAFSSVFVVLNSLLLRRFTPRA
ncbi:heavy metal translocating P-type ATPase [Aestuariimicrobium kwangyangense]|uniref:heavy metal translocating P-type ATPase n=1 Tax=Aestuariimicrobium kwangyangense TaxID=396389 RepID=UPI0003B3CC03|nr:heavy metal translocating P-type ATPase [Aestuariimicrobium kwangyangense]